MRLPPRLSRGIDPGALFLSLLVVLLHIALPIRFFSNVQKKEPKKEKHLVVRTVAAPKPTKTSFKAASSGLSSSPPDHEKTPPQKEPAPPAKKPKQAPKPAPKTPPPKKKESSPVPKKKEKTDRFSDAEKVKKEELEKSLRKMEETIAKIARKSDTIPMGVPIAIPGKISFEDQGESEDPYVSSLISKLRESLRLESRGEVKIELTLLADGTASNIRILSETGEETGKKLERDLRAIRFPPVPEKLRDGNGKVFIVTFYNDF